MAEDTPHPTPDREQKLTTVANLLNQLGQSLGADISQDGEAGMKLDNIKLTDSQKKQINSLAEVVKDDPTLIIESIKNSPPAVDYSPQGEKITIQPVMEFLEPTEDEIRVIELVNSLDKKGEDPYLKPYVTSLVNFLAMPRVDDKIGDHTLRQHYERVMSIILNFTEDTAAGAPNAPQPIGRDRLDKQFTDWWGNNKNSKNARHRVFSAMGMMRQISDSDQIKTIAHNFRGNFESLKYTEPYLPPDQINESVDFMSAAVCAVLSQYTQEQKSETL